jgi:hypothetical protein
VVDHIDTEIRQLRADVVEDPAGADQARRVAGVEGHQRFKVAKDRVEHVSRRPARH